MLNNSLINDLHKNKNLSSKTKHSKSIYETEQVERKNICSLPIVILWTLENPTSPILSSKNKTYKS